MVSKESIAYRAKSRNYQNLICSTLSSFPMIDLAPSIGLPSRTLDCSTVFFLVFFFSNLLVRFVNTLKWLSVGFWLHVKHCISFTFTHWHCGRMTLIPYDVRRSCNIRSHDLSDHVTYLITWPLTVMTSRRFNYITAMPSVHYFLLSLITDSISTNRPRGLSSAR